MDSWIRVYAPLLGRILLGGFFLLSGIQKALNFSGYLHFYNSFGYQNSLLFSTIIISVEIFLGLMLVVDMKTRLVSLVLAVYLITISLVFVQIGSVYQAQSFLQNIAIVGGLLMCATYGTSQWTPRWQR